MSGSWIGGCSRGLLPAMAALSVACSSPQNKQLYTAPSDCDTTGTWAIFVEVGVEWESAVISAGAGTVKQWILSTMSIGADGKVHSTAHACGIGAQNVPLGSPWFSTIAVPQLQLDHEWTGVAFLPDLFDKGTLEETTIPMSVSSPDPLNPSIGDSIITSPAPFEFGIMGLDPNTPWPAPEQIGPNIVDSDQDGFPGITGVPFSGPVPGEAQGVEFKDPRLTIAENPPPRASKLFLALRTRAGLQGTLTACSPPRLEGHVTPNTLLVETRNVACLVAGTDQPCAPDQVKFIDDNLPKFVANDKSSWVGVKVAPNTTCKEVRELKY